MIEAGDRRRVALLLDAFDRAIAEQSTNLLYEFGISLNIESGCLPSDWRRLSNFHRAAFIADAFGSEDGSEDMQGSWLWLTDVAAASARSGDLDFAVRVILAIWLWSVEFAPKLNFAALTEGVVPSPQRASLAGAYSIAFDALDRHPHDEKLKKVIGMLAPIVADDLSDLVAPRVRAIAKTLTRT